MTGLVREAYECNAEAGLSEKTSLMFYDRESAPVFFFPCRFHLNSTLLVGGNAGEDEGKLWSTRVCYLDMRESERVIMKREREREM